MSSNPCKEVDINGNTYVLQSETEMAKGMDGMAFKIVRTHSAGVYAGYVESRVGKEVVIRNARRLWRWYGAASLSELAMRGTSQPDKCKFPMAVDRVELMEAIEIIDCTEMARKSIQEVPTWSAQ